MGNAFQPGEYVVYPTHGVGCVVSVAEREVAGADVEFLVVEFAREAMTLHIPEARVATSGLRGLSSRAEMAAALAVLSKPRRKASVPFMRQIRTLEDKINSGDPTATAEIVRDMNMAAPNNTARRLYEAAMARLVHELALVEGIEHAEAQTMIEAQLRLSGDDSS